MFKVEIDLASKTSKQDNDEEQEIPGEKNVPYDTKSPNPTLQSILVMFPQWCHEDEEQYRRRIDNIKTQVQPFVTPSDPTLFFEDTLIDHQFMQWLNYLDLFEKFLIFIVASFHHFALCARIHF